MARGDLLVRLIKTGAAGDQPPVRATASELTAEEWRAETASRHSRARPATAGPSSSDWMAQEVGPPEPHPVPLQQSNWILRPVRTNAEDRAFVGALWSVTDPLTPAASPHCIAVVFGMLVGPSEPRRDRRSPDLPSTLPVHGSSIGFLPIRSRQIPPRASEVVCDAA